MAIKNKLIGLILIIIGALPFLLKIDAINNSIGKYTWALPGGLAYQIIIIVLGVLLIWKMRAKVETRRE